MVPKIYRDLSALAILTDGKSKTYTLMGPIFSQDAQWPVIINGNPLYLMFIWSTSLTSHPYLERLGFRLNVVDTWRLLQIQGFYQSWKTWKMVQHYGKPGKLMKFNSSYHKIMENSWKINLVKNDFTSTILR